MDTTPVALNCGHVYWCVLKVTVLFVCAGATVRGLNVEHVTDQLH